MKIYVTAPLAMPVGRWLRRYTTALIVIALVAFTTLGVGIAQMLYTAAAPRTSASEVRAYTAMRLDQHERHRP
ncbi:MAG TPA: hypothetical protein VFU22_31875 [Roseiflexaceae bacterium]|nr:hypothetical protein [Roseiflexaceae bacterium]